MATIRLEDAALAFALGADSIWVTHNELPTITRIDPATNDDAAEIDMGAYGEIEVTDFVAAGSEGVWVSIFR